jgi:AcrR family transcriptional regulator
MTPRRKGANDIRDDDTSHQPSPTTGALIGSTAVTPPTKAKSRSKADQRAASLEQILDAAEYLFSRHGRHGVTMMDVAKRVGVHQSLLNYYFKDKRTLFEKVFARRAAETRDRRMRALDEYERGCGGRPTVEGALHAFLDTDLDLYQNGGDGWRNYGAMSAQASMAPEWGARLMDEHFDPVVLRLLDVLQKAMPDCPRERLFWGYHFVSGALILTLARTGRIDKLSDGLCHSDDLTSIKTYMAEFMAAGFHALESFKKR